MNIALFSPGRWTFANMALITISGFPCSGKTRRAEQLKNALEACLQSPEYTGPALKVVVLSDDKLNISRDAYKGLLNI